MDVADGAAIERGLSQLAERFGHVDILINNAGIAESKPYHRSDDEMFSRMMAVNALAVMRLCRALLPPMVARGWGRSVIVASNAGLSGYAYSSAYCASKHAVLGLMRAIALEIARSEVTINAVCPGWVDTDMAKEAVDRIADKTSKSSADARKALERMSPQGRMVQPAEVASLVAYLCMQQARSVHGQALVMDGGAMMR
jgi:NAD(P)-dependent dehydrogenase (short-subunit alcohol dehydrogenase family)